MKCGNIGHQIWQHWKISNESIQNGISRFLLFLNFLNKILDLFNHWILLVKIYFYVYCMQRKIRKCIYIGLQYKTKIILQLFIIYTKNLQSSRWREPIRYFHSLKLAFNWFTPTVAANSCTERCVLYCDYLTFAPAYLLELEWHHPDVACCGPMTGFNFSGLSDFSDSDAELGLLKGGIYCLCKGIIWFLFQVLG